MGYASGLERDYLRAFAGYRLAQLALSHQMPEEAQTILERLQKNYKSGDNGYIYTAMTAALLESYKTTEDLDLACQAAAETFDDIRASNKDPGIEYLDDPIIETSFYFTSMRHYGSNPDNLFAVPDEIDSMVSIPICLRLAP